MTHKRCRKSLQNQLHHRIQQWIYSYQTESVGEDNVQQCIRYLQHNYPTYKRLRTNVFTKVVQKGIDEAIGMASVSSPISQISNGSAVADDDEEDDDDDDGADAKSLPLTNSEDIDTSMIDSKLQHNNAAQSMTNINILTTSMRSMYASDKTSRKNSAANTKLRSSQRHINTLFSTSSLSSVTYVDVGGLDMVLKEIRELIEPALTHPELFKHLGVRPPLGLLLHGPSGCGKTLCVNALCNELNVQLLCLSPSDIASNMSGESEAKIRQVFADASTHAPCILFIDDIDVIASKREHASKDMERRIVAQLLASLDALSLSTTSANHVFVIGATSRPDALDAALRRAGRLDREILIGIPDENARSHIFQVLTRTMRIHGEVDTATLARNTAGFVGSDIVSVCQQASVAAVQRALTHTTNRNRCSTVTVSDDVVVNNETSLNDGIRHCFSHEELESLYIECIDFDAALQTVQPSFQREGFATIPNVSWTNIGALHDVKRDLQLAIVLPIIHPELFESVHLNIPAGVLLYGPPGCGKTLIAKAVANESRANFISIKGPELLNKYVGESELAVRKLFRRARASSPSVIFFDEMDALCPKRGSGRVSEGNSERVVNQLLTEMDGLDSRKQVFIVAATNRPDIIDPAILRPGRLDKLIYVSLPNTQDRVQILTQLCRKSPLAPDVNLTEIAADSRCEGYSGADLNALVREASMLSVQEQLTTIAPSGELPGAGLSRSTRQKLSCVITVQHFNTALHQVFPSVSHTSAARYDRIAQSLRCARESLAKSTSNDSIT